MQQLYADMLITDRDNYTDFIGYFEMSPLNTMAHVLGAKDHYGSIPLNEPGTDEMNRNVTNQGHEAYIPGFDENSNPYNRYCIYGEDDIPGKDADIALEICTGCTMKIKNYIEKLIAGTEQIG